jgi:hypothetical protein
MFTTTKYWMLLAAVGICICLSGDAAADPVVGEMTLNIAVGDTASVDVGFARGLQCDDLTIIRAELRGATPTSNRLFVTGLRQGVTQCRAGTLGPPTVLVYIAVKEAASR